MGAGQDWGRGLIQLTAAALGIIWSLRLLVHPLLTTEGASGRSQPDTSTSPTPSLVGRGRKLGIPQFRNPKSPNCFIVLLALLTIPLIPLPPRVLQTLSPSAFAIATQALPGWPARAPFDELRQTLELRPPRLSPAQQLPPAGAWRPLALVPHDTALTLSIGMAYALVAAVMAFYPWPNGGAAAVSAVLSCLIAVGLLEALYGLSQASGGYNRLYWYDCPSSACMGTYINRDHYAGLLEMIFPLALARTAVWYATLRGEVGALRHPSGSVHRRVLIDAIAGTLGPLVGAAAIAILVLVAMAVSGSRSAFGASIASLLVMVWLLPREQFVQRGLGAWGLGGLKPQARTPARPHTRPSQVLSAAVAALAVLWLTFPQIFGRLWEGDLARPLMAADTFHMALHFPLFGIGLGNFASIFPFYRAETVAVWQWGVSNAHNDYLEWMAEVGLPAAVLSFFLLAAFGRRALRALRAAQQWTPQALTRWGLAAGVLALLLHCLTDFNLHIPANAVVFAVLVGSLVRLSHLDIESLSDCKSEELSDLASESSSHCRNDPMTKSLNESIPMTRSPNESILRRSTSPSGFPLSAFRFPLSAFRFPLLNFGPWTILALCLIWGGFIWRQWDADAAYHRVYPDLRLQDLAAPLEEATGAEALLLTRHAAELVPGAPRFQAGVGEQLIARTVDPSTESSARDGLFDAAIVAYIRSLWAAPLQPHVLLALAAAAEPIYQPDPGTEPGVIYDLVGRAAALAPYEARLQLDVADWYLNHWDTFPNGLRPQVGQQVEAALAIAARSAELQGQVEKQKAQSTKQKTES